jgi:hypothetical protein
MLEAGDVLRTWKLAEPPAPGKAVRAEPSFDNRKLYLDHEGPVSGRGTVVAWDRGTFGGEPGGPEREETRLTIRFQGGRLRGPGILEREESGQWWFRACADPE